MVENIQPQSQNPNQSFSNHPFNPQNIIGGSRHHFLEEPNTWHQIEPSQTNEGHPPCPRSLHASVAMENNFYIFGGYDGTNRRNDFFKFSFQTNNWIEIVPQGGSQPPSPRDRHTAVVNNRCIYIFGGYDGYNRVDDFHRYCVATGKWSLMEPVNPEAGPSPRHSHSAVVFNSHMYIFGGYDGHYKNDLYKYSFSTNQWSEIRREGMWPKSRYRTSATVLGQRMYLFGGHDGARQLNDFYYFSFVSENWTLIDLSGMLIPSPRDSHVLLTHGNSIFLFGGCTGNPRSDFYQFKVDEDLWTAVQCKQNASDQPGSALLAPNQNLEQRLHKAPSSRFCHAGQVIKNRLYIFGGYDGIQRLNDFYYFVLAEQKHHAELPSSTLSADLKSWVGNKDFSDVTLLLEGEQKSVYAHKLILSRCPYFAAMFSESPLHERTSKPGCTIKLEKIRYDVLMEVLTYLYTDECQITLHNVMQLFETADLFGIDRLKFMCEQAIINNIDTENAAAILHASDQHSAQRLRDQTMDFIINNFDGVSKSPGFEQLARTDVELVIEILKLRK